MPSCSARASLQDRHDWDAVQDGDLSLAAQGFGQIGAGLIARVAVLGAHEGVDRAVGVGVDGDHDDALVLGHALHDIRDVGIHRLQADLQIEV